MHRKSYLFFALIISTQLIFSSTSFANIWAYPEEDAELLGVTVLGEELNDYVEALQQDNQSCAFDSNPEEDYFTEQEPLESLKSQDQEGVVEPAGGAQDDVNVESSDSSRPGFIAGTIPGYTKEYLRKTKVRAADSDFFKGVGGPGNANGMFVAGEVIYNANDYAELFLLDPENEDLTNLDMSRFKEVGGLEEGNTVVFPNGKRQTKEEFGLGYYNGEGEVFKFNGVKEVLGSFSLIESEQFLMRAWAEIPRSSRSMIKKSQAAAKKLEAEGKHEEAMAKYAEIGKVVRVSLGIHFGVAVPQIGMGLRAAPFLKAIGQPKLASNVAGDYFGPFAIGVPARNWLRDSEEIMKLEHNNLQSLPTLTHWSFKVGGNAAMNYLSNNKELIPAIKQYALVDSITSYGASAAIMLFFALDESFDKYKLFEGDWSDSDISSEIWGHGSVAAANALFRSTSGTMLTFCQGIAGGSKGLANKLAIDRTKLIINPFFVGAAGATFSEVNAARGRGDIAAIPGIIKNDLVRVGDLSVVGGAFICVVTRSAEGCFMGAMLPFEATERVSQEALAGFSKTTKSATLTAEIIKAAVPSTGMILFRSSSKLANQPALFFIKAVTTAIPASIYFTETWTFDPKVGYGAVTNALTPVYDAYEPSLDKIKDAWKPFVDKANEQEWFSISKAVTGELSSTYGMAKDAVNYFRSSDVKAKENNGDSASKWERPRRVVGSCMHKSGEMAGSIKNKVICMTKKDVSDPSGLVRFFGYPISSAENKEWVDNATNFVDTASVKAANFFDVVLGKTISGIDIVMDDYAVPGINALSQKAVDHSETGNKLLSVAAGASKPIVPVVVFVIDDIVAPTYNAAAEGLISATSFVGPAWILLKGVGLVSTPWFFLVDMVWASMIANEITNMLYPNDYPEQYVY
jgi:hypothetical protein